MECKITRTCKDCKNVDTIEVTKVEAAFELYDSKAILKSPCSNCGSTNCESFCHHHPAIEKELLDIWGTDSELFFMKQDQDLYLAKYEYFPMLLEAIDESKYLDTKINILIQAICVLLYHYTVPSYDYSIEENNTREIIANEVRLELIKRKAKILNSGDTLMTYIQKFVYPQIGEKVL